MNLSETTLAMLERRVSALRVDWHSKKPFRYLVIDDFLDASFASAILAEYPAPEDGFWDSTTYIHQHKKFTLTKDFPAVIEQFFQMTASEKFRTIISEITGINDLIYDSELFGGGLHQIAKGGFLDVHVDYNFHPKTKLHRRLNLLVYLNPDWKEEYEGYLELWDMQANKRIENLAPLYNRCVIFETNEVSYHGHPHPLNTPAGMTRKSIAIYYYTKEREGEAIALEHNTIYKYTTGLRGYMKSFTVSAIATLERTKRHGVDSVFGNLVGKTFRRLKGLPPKNR